MGYDLHFTRADYWPDRAMYDCFDFCRPGPDHARHAFGAFGMFAERDLFAADAPDADGLLYQYGPSGSEGEPVFRLSFVRQVATDLDGGLAQIECHLDYVMTEDLAGLGVFHQWWFPTQGVARCSCCSARVAAAQQAHASGLRLRYRTGVLSTARVAVSGPC